LGVYHGSASQVFSWNWQHKGLNANDLYERFCRAEPRIEPEFRLRACAGADSGTNEIQFFHSLSRFSMRAWNSSPILLILWLLGFSFHVGGALIHIILVIVVIVVIIRLVTGRGV
jgi:hypothetical protein